MLDEIDSVRDANKVGPVCHIHCVCVFVCSVYRVFHPLGSVSFLDLIPHVTSSADALSDLMVTGFTIPEWVKHGNRPIEIF